MEKIPGKRVIIDLDMGSDDYLALLFLLHAENHKQVKIEAITCCYGNTTVDNVIKNVVRLLEIENRTDIPVYIGAHESLIAYKEYSVQFHGTDGFGDLEHDTEPDLSIVKVEHAALAMNRILANDPKAITVMAVGPLTNLALAIKLNKNFVDNIKDVWIMGGNYKGVGNCSPHAEFNFYMDPEAVYITLESLKCPIFIFPWEPCLNSTISLDWRFKELCSTRPAFELLTRVDKKIYSDAEYKNYLPCDAFLCFCYLYPENGISKQSAHHIAIELHRGITRGQVIVDVLNERPNVVIIENFNENLFKKFLIEMTSNTN